MRLARRFGTVLALALAAGCTSLETARDQLTATTAPEQAVEQPATSVAPSEPQTNVARFDLHHIKPMRFTFQPITVTCFGGSYQWLMRHEAVFYTTALAHQRRMLLAWDAEKLFASGGTGYFALYIKGEHEKTGRWRCAKIEDWFAELGQDGSGIYFHIRLREDGMPAVIQAVGFGVVTGFDIDPESVAVRWIGTGDPPLRVAPTPPTTSSELSQKTTNPGG